MYNLRTIVSNQIKFKINFEGVSQEELVTQIAGDYMTLG
jgi:hypothetical protein